MTNLSLRVRFRVTAEDGSDQPQFAIRDGWSPARAAVIICDMWDTHHCLSAANRVAEMAPHLNKVVARMRQMDALIIHCPSRCMDFYRGLPARKRATEARHVDAPADFDWNTWNLSKESALPRTFADPGPCSCHSPEPCCDLDDPIPWTRQIESIDIYPALRSLKTVSPSNPSDSPSSRLSITLTFDGPVVRVEQFRHLANSVSSNPSMANLYRAPSVSTVTDGAYSYTYK